MMAMRRGKRPSFDVPTSHKIKAWVFEKYSQTNNAEKMIEIIGVTRSYFDVPTCHETKVCAFKNYQTPILAKIFHEKFKFHILQKNL